MNVWKKLPPGWYAYEWGDEEDDGDEGGGDEGGGDEGGGDEEDHGDEGGGDEDPGEDWGDEDPEEGDGDGGRDFSWHKSFDGDEDNDKREREREREREDQRRREEERQRREEEERQRRLEEQRRQIEDEANRQRDESNLTAEDTDGDGVPEVVSGELSQRAPSGDPTLDARLEEQFNTYQEQVSAQQQAFNPENPDWIFTTGSRYEAPQPSDDTPPPSLFQFPTPGAEPALPPAPKERRDGENYVNTWDPASPYYTGASYTGDIRSDDQRETQASTPVPETRVPEVAAQAAANAVAQAGGTPAEIAATAEHAARIASDRQTLAQQTGWTRAAFRSQYGDRADEEWVRQHEADLARNQALYGAREPTAGTAPLGTAPVGTPVAPNRRIGAVPPPGEGGYGAAGAPTSVPAAQSPKTPTAPGVVVEAATPSQPTRYPTPEDFANAEATDNAMLQQAPRPISAPTTGLPNIGQRPGGADVPPRTYTPPPVQEGPSRERNTLPATLPPRLEGDDPGQRPYTPAGRPEDDPGQIPSASPRLSDDPGQSYIPSGGAGSPPYAPTQRALSNTEGYNGPYQEPPPERFIPTRNISRYDPVTGQIFDPADDRQTLASTDTAIAPETGAAEPAYRDPVLAAIRTSRPLETIASMVVAAQDPTKPTGDAPIHVAGGITALLRGDKEGVWAEPYLNDVARLAWAREESQNGRESDPRNAPVEYVEKWKDAFYGSDQNVPLVKELDQELIDYVGERTKPGQPFRWQDVYGPNGDKGLIQAQLTDRDCGPTAFTAIMRSRGYNADTKPMFQFAMNRGYHNGNEFNGPAAMVNMVQREAGLEAEQVTLNEAGWKKVDAELAAGRPVMLSGPGHWWAVSAKNDQGQYYAGATALQGNNQWLARNRFIYNGAANTAVLVRGEVKPDANVVKTLGLEPPKTGPGNVRPLLSGNTEYATPAQRATTRLSQEMSTAQAAPKDLPPILQGATPRAGLVAGQAKPVDQMASIWTQAREKTGDRDFADGLSALLIGEGGLKGGVGDQGQSFGPYQFYWGGGEGNNFEAWLRKEKGFKGTTGEAQQMAKDVDLASEFYIPRVKLYYDQGKAMGYQNPVQAIAAGGHNRGAVRDAGVWQNYQEAWDNWKAGNPEQKRTVQSGSAATDPRLSDDRLMLDDSANESIPVTRRELTDAERRVSSLRMDTRSALAPGGEGDFTPLRYQTPAQRATDRLGMEMRKDLPEYPGDYMPEGGTPAQRRLPPQEALPAWYAEADPEAGLYAGEGRGRDVGAQVWNTAYEMTEDAEFATLVGGLVNGEGGFSGKKDEFDAIGIFQFDPRHEQGRLFAQWLQEQGIDEPVEKAARNIKYSMGYYLPYIKDAYDDAKAQGVTDENELMRAMVTAPSRRGYGHNSRATGANLRNYTQGLQEFKRGEFRLLPRSQW